jgi:CTP synthase
VVGKYTGYEDSYKSLNEAVYHGGFAHRASVKLNWVEAEALEKEGGAALLAGADAILVPGGFGSRGTRGMMKAAEYAREHSVPFFGICYGFQWATVEFARNVCGLEGADSTEVDENAPHKVIYKLRDLLGVDDLGGTMRLGAYPAVLAAESRARAAYAEDVAVDRHRHRYEVNQEFLPQLEAAGLKVSGISPDKKFVEIVEYPDHPWFLACQFHPEYKSRPLAPHPLFRDFIAAAYRQKQARRGGLSYQDQDAVAANPHR